MNQQLRQNTLNLLILVAVALSLFAAITAHSNDRLAASPTSVAVIDWLNMTDKIDAWAIVKVKLEDEEAAFEAEWESRRNQIKAKQEELKILPKDGAAFDAAASELRSLIAQTNTWADLAQSGIAGSALKAKLRLYQKIVIATEAVAIRDGWDLVLWNDSPSKVIDFKNLTYSANLISGRQIFYVKDAIDITDAVIAKMNNNQQTANAGDDQ